MFMNNCTSLIVVLLVLLFADCSKKPTASGLSSSSTTVISPSIAIGSLHSGMTVQEVTAVMPQVLTDVRAWVMKANGLPE